MGLVLTPLGNDRHIGTLLAKRGTGGNGFRDGKYGRMMAARPTVPVVVGTHANIVMVVDLLRAMKGVVLFIGEMAKEE